MLRFFELNIGTGPATLCARCAAREAAPAMYETADLLSRLERLAAHAREAGALNIALTGVEPFAHPELPTLVHSAVELGFERICLDTNGRALAIGGNAEGVVAAGVRHIEVTLVAEGAAYDDICGREGLFDAAVAGIAAFRSAAVAAGVPVCVTGRVPVCRHNAGHVSAAVSALGGVGAVLVRLDPNGQTVSAEIADAAEQAAIPQQVWLSAPGRSRFPSPINRIVAAQ